MIDYLLIVTALAQGFFGSPHCLGMCGGIVSALSFALAKQSPSQRLILQTSYHLGRLLSYSFLGLVIGFAGKGLLTPLFEQQWLYALTGVVMVMVGLYLTGWWRGLDRLERLGASIWQAMSPLRKRFMPINSMGRALAAGMLWGFLPCGLVYSALLLAFTSANTQTASLTMLAFGIGTLPMMLLAGSTAGVLKQKLQQQGWRTANALLIIGFGLWTLMRAFMQHDTHHHTAERFEPHTTPLITSNKLKGSDTI
ncbi:sulfite exporter TauE/SafE family protein [Agitococcus lubricus]|uniref:Urease accessory protein UreH-like transmembrane domain-containing protein n=1 Tax=Agitococcus lubricus TaxID=1077255 RepID=A0A2T5IX37_9GAMM|nr:sulfite exporter TauE/SafE family protein [Agitococcus lubricus]PTQ88497.1 hypothetical protein C8N29_11118 [Agitococcus lubricus]